LRRTLVLKKIVRHCEASEAISWHKMKAMKPLTTRLLRSSQWRLTIRTIKCLRRNRRCY